MKCDTCFWMKSIKVTTGVINTVCQLEPLSTPVSPNGRCSHWKFLGRECCGNCYNFRNNHCCKDGPVCAETPLLVSGDDWCGQFKGA